MGSLTRRVEIAFRAIAVSGALTVGFVLAEILVRLFPVVLPDWYRAEFPVGGIELFHRGVLSRTPIEGVPLPYRLGRGSEMVGEVPRDLEWKGLVSPADNPDRDVYSDSDIRFRMDRNGFPNATEMTRADLLLVGDSFALAGGVLSPEGLQVGLARSLDLAVFNLGIPAVGPIREEWLLAEIGLSLEPRGVVWLFFGGNDISDTAALLARQDRGIRTYEDLFGEFSPPSSFLLDLGRKSLARQETKAEPKSPLPGFSFETDEGERWPLWFHPAYLRALARDRKSWEASAGWRATAEVLSRVESELRRRDIRLLIVYVPSKAQVYLPFVEKNPGLAWETASFGNPGAMGGTPTDFWQRAMANREGPELLLSEFCDRKGIQFMSLTPILEELAKDGKLVFLSADTHWNEHGQRALIDPLVAWWTSEGAVFDGAVSRPEESIDGTDGHLAERGIPNEDSWRRRSDSNR